MRGKEEGGLGAVLIPTAYGTWKNKVNQTTKTVPVGIERILTLHI